MWLRYFGIFVVAVVLLSPTVYAAPAAPIELTLKQPDGTTFAAKQRGDEFANWVETLDGHTIVQQNGTWYYAQKAANGQLTATQDKVGALSARALGALPLHLSPPIDPRAFEVHVPRSLAAGPEKTLSHTQKVVTILVNYTDISCTYSDASFQTLMYGTASGSVKDFYLENSYSNFTVAPAAESYITADDGIIHVSRPIAHPNIGGGDSRTEASAIMSAADGSIDYASFDSNADGTITSDELAIVMILAGYENSYDSSTPRVWGHAWQLAAPLTLDGKNLQPYTMFGERHGAHQATIGIMCHELGHLMLLLPDLYDTDGGSEGIGEWGLMGGGSWNTTITQGDTPAHLSAWCKSVLDMVTPTDIFSSTTGATILEGSNNASILRLWIDKYRVGEYFLIENRQLTGFDAGLPGAGLLIWHADDRMTTNEDENHKWVDLEEADGLAHLDAQANRGDTGDPYPGSTSNFTFNGASTPNSKDYNNAATGVIVTNVSSSGASMTADLTPSATGGKGNHIRYDENGATGYAWGYGSTTVWTALRVTNSTSMDTLDGFEVFINSTTASVDFYLYSSIPGGTPTGLLYTQTGFSAVYGWNRFLISTPQSFPASSDRVIVLRIVNSSGGWPACTDSGGVNSGRSYIDDNGAGAFYQLSSYPSPDDLNQVALLSQTAVPVADLSSATYSVTEGTATVTVTVNLDMAPASSCSVNYTTTAGTATAVSDYTTASGTLSFTSSDTSKTFAVTIIDDGAIESSEDFTVTLSTPVDCTLSGTNDPATVTITSNDASSSLVYVNFSWTGGESGASGNPYNTFAEGLAATASSGVMKIKGDAGDIQTDWTGTISSAMSIQSDPVGLVRIGEAGQGSSPPSGSSSAWSDAEQWYALMNALAARAAAAARAGSGSGAASSAVLTGTVYEPVLPFTQAKEGVQAAQADSVLALRLRSSSDIDPATLLAPVTAATPDALVEWRPVQEDDNRDLWVIVRPGDRWLQDDLIAVTADAQTATGGTAGPETRQFRVESQEQADARAAQTTEPIPQPQPKVDYDVSELEDAVGATGEARLTPTGDDALVTPVDEGIEIPLAIGPERVYEAPQRVWLPLPAGTDASAVRLYYYHANGDDRGWYPAENVEGWMIPGSYLSVEVDGVSHLGFLVRHGGIVQLGIPK